MKDLILKNLLFLFLEKLKNSSGSIKMDSLKNKKIKNGTFQNVTLKEVILS
jgi:hypothetical protein